MQKTLATDVFTPSKPARATYVDRPDLTRLLWASLLTPGKQIVVYGHSGSGKTTLLVNTLNDDGHKAITSRCTNTISFEQLILDAFDQLNPYYSSQQSTEDAWKGQGEIAADYLFVKSKILAERSSSSTETSSRILPPQLTVQNLAKFMGTANCCWVLEDFHKIPSIEKRKLAQAMKLFMDMADQFPKLRIIAIGAVDTAREVVECDPEMRNRVSEIHVPLMTSEELRQIIQQGEKVLNVSVIETIKSQIVRYSSGLASVCHQLCLNMCFAANVYETVSIKRFLTPDTLKSAVTTYFNEASDTIKAAFEKALRRQRERKYDNGRIILAALSQLGDDGATFGELSNKIKIDHSSYPTGNLRTYLSSLQSSDKGGLIRYFSGSGKFSFADPIFRAYALVLFSQHEPQPQVVVTDELLVELSALIAKTLRNSPQMSDWVVDKS